MLTINCTIVDPDDEKKLITRERRRLAIYQERLEIAD
jgi:hypothetical protein